MVIRDYRQGDGVEVGLLIKETYSGFNLAFLDPGERSPYFGPFTFAGDGIPAHQQTIHEVIQSQFVYLTEEEGIIAGVLRGRMDRLGSLFVKRDFHRQGIGKALVELF